MVLWAFTFVMGYQSTVAITTTFTSVLSYVDISTASSSRAPCTSLLGSAASSRSTSSSSSVSNYNSLLDALNPFVPHSNSSMTASSRSPLTPTSQDLVQVFATQGADQGLGANLLCARVWSQSALAVASIPSATTIFVVSTVGNDVGLGAGLSCTRIWSQSPVTVRSSTSTHSPQLQPSAR